MTSTKKILVVEDDGMLRKVMSDKLKVLGYDVYQAEDGQEAIDLILDKRPHLVLLDLLIPKIDGFVVLQKIREYPDAEIANTRVMVLSNLWTDKDILRVKSLKIDEYFVKAQTDLEEVFNKVKNLLN
jgi:DNA-binding response OmpR family regulator